jgi:hypothetical protein
MPSPQSQKARSHPAPFSFGLSDFAATRPAGREDRRALVRFRVEREARGRRGIHAGKLVETILSATAR